jgi:glycosyltransferase involved in cell wall biosynthesis
MNNNQLISVIIPVRNGKNYIAEAIASIKTQTVETEIIVVDDNSSDHSGEIAQNMGCRVVESKENLGGSKARNLGLSHACGDFILFCDHDDFLNNDVLSQMYNKFKKDTDLEVVIAKVKDFISPELPNEVVSGLKIREEAYYGLLTGAVLFKKEVFDKIGKFDETLKSVQGMELQLRFDKFGIRTKKIDVISTNRRIHKSNFGRENHIRQYIDMASIMRAKLKK